VKLRILAIAVLTLFSAIVAEPAEFRIQPSFSISEEYNDNILLEEDKTEDYITRLLPSVTLKYEAPLWKWDIRYTLDYRDYAKGTRADEAAHKLSADGYIELLNERLFMNLSDKFSRESLDITRDFTKESLFVNQSDKNVFTANPYFVLRPNPLTSITIGYIYTNIWYREDTAVDKADNTAYIESAFELSPKVQLNAGYKYTQEDSDAKDYDKSDVYIGSRYEYAEGSYLSGTIGNSWLDFKGGKSHSNVFWNGSIVHRFSAFTGSLEASLDYIENPQGNPSRVNTYSMSVFRARERSSLNFSASVKEYRDSETKGLQTKTYTGNGNIKYEFTPKLTGNVDFTVEKFEEKLQLSYTRRFLVGLEIEYMFSKGLALNFKYRHTDSYSPKIASDNYDNNRFIVMAEKSF
jgi:hypothetical protein